VGGVCLRDCTDPLEAAIDYEVVVVEEEDEIGTDRSDATVPRNRWATRVLKPYVLDAARSQLVLQTEWIRCRAIVDDHHLVSPAHTGDGTP
jgi:hypothetical protein